MGSFYTNITVLSAGGPAVVEELRGLGREALVADLGSACVVYDRECDEQDTAVLAALAGRLAERLPGTAFAVLNHDDDVLFQIERHQRLARRLGQPEASIGSGFDYVSGGEIPSGVEPGRIPRVGRGGEGPGG
jgi:hypothetical protein